MRSTKGHEVRIQSSQRLGNGTNLTSISSVSGTRLGENRLELGQALLRDTIAIAIVAINDGLVSSLGVDDRDGNDLRHELASVLSAHGLLVRVGRECVLRLARDAVMRSDVLACEVKCLSARVTFCQMGWIPYW